MKKRKKIGRWNDKAGVVWLDGHAGSGVGASLSQLPRVEEMTIDVIGPDG